MRLFNTTFINRMLRFVAVVMLQGLYLPLNRTLTGGVLSRIPLDDAVPLIPVWTIPYVLWLPACLALGFWASWKMPEELFRAYFYAAIFTIGFSMLFFILYPTYILRPEISGSDMFSNMLRSVYQNDRLYNAFPSGHVYLAVLTALFYLCWRSSRHFSLRSIRWNHWNTWLWIGLVIVVSLSTIFTGQHSIIDIPGGMLIAVAGYLIGRWWTRYPREAGAYEIQAGS